MDINRPGIVLDPLSTADHGGWVVDGDYLMAHGLGRPVSDACLKLDVGCDSLGEYRLWVKTRDWVAPQGPGRFQVVVNGKPVEKVFGVGDGA